MPVVSHVASALGKACGVNPRVQGTGTRKVVMESIVAGVLWHRQSLLSLH